MDRAHARAKYDEIMEAEAGHFPHSQQSLSEMFPAQAEAAAAQSHGAEGQRALNEELDRAIHAGRRQGGGTGEGGEEQAELQTNLHEKGP